MPSLRHAVVARAVGLLRRNYPVDDIAGMRARLIEDNRRVEDGPPRDIERSHTIRIGNEHGFPVHWLCRAERPQASRTVFYLHGGGYVKPSDKRHWRFATRLADALDARVVLPLYPLAPEFTVEDSFDALVDLLSRTVMESPEGVVLAGDSAGGGYALALAQALRDRGGTLPAALVLLAPWVDLTGRTPGLGEAAARDPWLSFDHLDVYAAFWAGSTDAAALADPRVSPGLGDHAVLPPTLVLCGTRDLLQPGCDALFERAETAQWELEYVVAPGLVHVYPLLPIPEAKAAFEHIVRFCRRVLGPD